MAALKIFSSMRASLSPRRVQSWLQSVEIIPIWPFLYSAVLGISFLHYGPTLLALVSRAAPAKGNVTLMGFYEKMRPAEFWAMHAAIAAAGGLLGVLFGRGLSRALHPARSVDELSPNR